jgi:hypothetical protein
MSGLHSGFLAKILYEFPYRPCMLLSTPISYYVYLYLIVLLMSGEQQPANYKFPHYVIFSILLSVFPLNAIYSPQHHVLLDHMPPATRSTHTCSFVTHPKCFSVFVITICYRDCSSFPYTYRMNNYFI